MGCLDPSHTCQNVRTKHRPTTPPMSRLSAEDVAHHAQDQPAKGSRHKGAGEAQPGGHRRAVEEVFLAEAVGGRNGLTCRGYVEWCFS